MPSLSGDIITTVIYGTAATIIGLVTIYQAHKAWTLWHSHRQSQEHSQPDVELGPGPSRVTFDRLEVAEAVALPAQVSDDAFVRALQDSRSGLRPLNGPSIDRSLTALPTNSPTREPPQGCDQASSRDNPLSSTADAITPMTADLGEGLSTKPSTSPYNSQNEY
ncbi:hypothetical protein JMJ35_002242 [Cladonia borealis]|uniref:Uncharacterized protein n=1 Tax=Cladonia borealis TaxID=184061 RepID=A0AA39R4S6_9LECA|nr:hypothetical protein JMJ35_002242 [Cladonia borealis]